MFFTLKTILFDSFESFRRRPPAPTACPSPLPPLLVPPAVSLRVVDLRHPSLSPFPPLIDSPLSSRCCFLNLTALLQVKFPFFYSRFLYPGDGLFGYRVQRCSSISANIELSTSGSFPRAEVFREGLPRAEAVFCLTPSGQVHSTERPTYTGESFAPQLKTFTDPVARTI